MRIRNNRGQAMVETLLIIVIMTGMVFAALQLCIVAVNDLITNEAAYTVARSVMVTPTNDNDKLKKLKNKVSILSAILLLPHLSLINYIPYKIAVYEKDDEQFKYLDGKQVHRFELEITYATKLMFSSLFGKRIDIPLLGGMNGFMENTARSRIIKSPEEDYYYKAYKNAKKFQK